jgi:ParB-like chromosome segregation protein Spo0J
MTSGDLVDIANIKIGERHRNDMGDLSALADSIKEVGLLQPIGITPANELVFGERRLKACRDILGYDKILARIVNLPSIAAGEYHENEFRKAFTVSERVAILQKLGRRPEGRPSKLGKYSEFSRGCSAGRAWE